MKIQIELTAVPLSCDTPVAADVEQAIREKLQGMQLQYKDESLGNVLKFAVNVESVQVDGI